jgi:glycosyltransferase involved in cell wall biosynthesis
VFVFLKPSSDQAARVTLSENELPRWFAAPIHAAFGHITLSSLASDAISASFNGERNFLIFTVSMQEVIASAALSTRNLATLFQWPISSENKFTPKDAARDFVLNRSRKILTYSRQSEGELRTRFPGSEVQWIGHFVDTDYFSPRDASNVEEFLLCVGDHKRLESIIAEIAHHLKVRVVRVSKSPSVKKYYDENPSSYVRLESDVSFARLRALYSSCALVLNAADDRLWPVGITSFCEAISMGRPVVTSGYHSCSGYAEEIGFESVRTVSELFSLNSWIAEIEGLLNAGAHMRSDAVDVARRYCSMASMTKTWSSVFGRQGS